MPIPLKPIDQMAYHPVAETLVDVLQARTQRDNSLFFRVVVAYYFSLAAAQMRCMIISPDKGEIPVNLYALNLAPSGYGKTQATNLMEEEVLHLFRHRFLDETFVLLAEHNLAKIASKRSAQKGTDPDDELKLVNKEFERAGEMVFSFDSGTAPAVKQLRHKLLLANAGSMNLIMDEVGSNLVPNKEVFDTFIELYDKGLSKTKLIKNTTDSVRGKEIVGKTPTNLLMFGVPHSLFDGAKVEDELMAMLGTGYARRCFFGYEKSAKRAKRTARQMYVDRTNNNNSTVLSDLADKLESLADMVNANKKLIISEETSILLNEYQLQCEARADQLPEHMETRKREMTERFFKVLKLAGAYAFIDDSTEVTAGHIENAIKLAEDSGDAFTLMLTRDKNWVKLARYIAAVGENVTQADLAEDLPFYRGGASVKSDMLTQAAAWGYKNNIIIKKSFENGIEFLRGETLKETDIASMVVAYSDNMTEGYRNERAPFDQLYRVTQAQGMHWVSHHLVNGYRNEENAIPGFNFLVIDVDGTIQLSTAKLLMSKYKALYYTTKRHTDDVNRFRILLPINFELQMDAKEFKEFYNNVRAWLPFDTDEQCSHRSKKWLSHDHHYEYTEGELLDALPFIPKTSKNEERKSLLQSQQSLDNLERWVINHIGDGNRNNMLLRYAMLLMDAGFDFEKIRTKVMELNNKIADKLEEAEIMSTIMISVAKNLSKRP
jgi:hypothetical protein